MWERTYMREGKRQEASGLGSLDELNRVVLEGFEIRRNGQVATASLFRSGVLHSLTALSCSNTKK